MQTLIIFWSSLRLEMVVSERQQDHPSCPFLVPSCPLLVPSKVGQIRLLIRKSLWLVPYLSCHSLKQRDSSISLNKSVSIPLLNYLTPSWGFFSYLLVLGCWELERFIEQYLLVRRFAIHLEIFLKKIFKNMAKFPKNISLKGHNFYCPHQGSNYLRSFLLWIKLLWTSR